MVVVGRGRLVPRVTNGIMLPPSSMDKGDFADDGGCWQDVALNVVTLFGHVVCDKHRGLLNIAEPPKLLAPALYDPAPYGVPWALGVEI